jgi:hypothetical protein
VTLGNMRKFRKRIVIAALALLLGSAPTFAQSVLTGYLPAGTILCTNPEKLADLPRAGDLKRNPSLMPTGCRAVDIDIPLRNAKRAGKVVCFETSADPEAFVCALADKVVVRQ